MTQQQLQTLESELQRRGYKKWTTCLTDGESWAWFKSIKDNDGNGYQMAFRVWDNTEYCGRYNLTEEFSYGFDFWTSAFGTDSRIDFTSNWEPICDIDALEKMAREFNELVRKFTDNRNEKS